MKNLLTGKVITNTAKDTSVVEVTSWKTHRLFHKRYKQSKRYLVHNANNTAQVGETVTIAPSRPISKLKHWTIFTAPAVPVAKAVAKKTKTTKETV